jgi:hypothetical protein
MISKLSLIKQKSVDMGGVHFNIEYNTKAQLRLSNKTLQMLNNLFGEYGISFDSIVKDWKSDSKAYHRQVYYQFYMKLNNLKDEEYILNQSFLLEKKYGNLIKIKNTQLNTSETYLALSIKDNFKKYKWDEQFNDILQLCDNNSNDLELMFGFYQRNRTDLIGGEIGYEIINRLIVNKVDLLISFGKTPYFTKE